MRNEWCSKQGNYAVVTCMHHPDSCLMYRPKEHLLKSIEAGCSGDRGDKGGGRQEEGTIGHCILHLLLAYPALLTCVVAL